MVSFDCIDAINHIAFDSFVIAAKPILSSCYFWLFPILTSGRLLIFRIISMVRKYDCDKVAALALQLQNQINVNNGNA